MSENGNVHVDLRSVPSVVWVCITVGFLGCITALVVLSATGSDATEFRSFMNTIMNIVTLLFTGTSAVYIGAAAKNSQATKEQTNGQLDKRIATQVAQQLVEHGMTKSGGEDNGRGPTV